jgi:PAS domain-containing protein
LDEDGEVRLFSILAFDITEDVLKDRALKESERRYRTLAEASQDMIFVINRDGLMQYINPQAENALRLKAEEVIGKSCRSFPC